MRDIWTQQKSSGIQEKTCKNKGKHNVVIAPALTSRDSRLTAVCDCVPDGDEG